jgi:hypothetical protein
MGLYIQYLMEAIFQYVVAEKIQFLISIFPEFVCLYMADVRDLQ